MEIKYSVEITEPQTHLVNVKMTLTRSQDKMTVFLPSWSPGSYLMREYARNIRVFRAQSSNGEFLYFEQVSKGEFEIDFTQSELKKDCREFTVEYSIYCHELTVRTSHVDESHAFLHGPSYLMGVKDCDIKPVIQFKFPGLWSKLHTSLKDISDQRQEFIYTADSYDDLIDCPVEIGCHESDGFMHEGKEHHLIWYGDQYPHDRDLKSDIKTIVETVASHFSSIPYDKYMFITHFKRGLYGGLEHKSSTALHFDGRRLACREDYINWLGLVAHEYFHTWNVKRIRPRELGPFDYLNENYTKMHWLTEGLTSFMDDLFVLRSGLCSLEEYLKLQTKNLKRYFSTPGKKFHSLEQSSFNAWIKLYRPDENSLNSSISYYLKGGLVFSTLYFEMVKQGKDIKEFLELLWQRYLANPDVGMDSEEVLKMIEDMLGAEARGVFEQRISTTEDIDFESYYAEFGMRFLWEQSEAAHLGVDLKFQGDRVLVDNVHLDGPAYQSGLNAGDEILSLNKVRLLKSDIKELPKMIKPNKNYMFLVNRLGSIMNIELQTGRAPKVLKSILIENEELAKKTFLGVN
ncbi:MAG: hypothetical protein CME62_09900 [Halobacteriovoraceae bacterium]|nr:hypothetical protein [Halobacteriovoraceae bacterium]|tara:strand:- start:16752 stop:18470 length:1719 start_codon:yes stop_codon:yes gene_type:complete